MIDFDILWREVVERSACFPVVQEYEELKHVFNLVKGCMGYLEIGTAEGNSLYILSHAIEGLIYSIDFGEKHTTASRNAVLNKLRETRDLPNDKGVYFVAGNSHDPKCLQQIKHEHLVFDVVLIDAGHSYEDVIADASMYGSLAKKYIIFHDVCLPEVNKAFQWYVAQRPDCESYKFINSDTFGYGIMRIK